MTYVIAGEEWTDRNGDLWLPSPAGRYEARWTRYRDGCVIEAHADHVEIAWTLYHFVQFATVDPCGWIEEHLSVKSA